MSIVDVATAVTAALLAPDQDDLAANAGRTRYRADAPPQDQLRR